MDKPFEIKEFDSIICNADYMDDEKYKYLNQKEFNNLVAFIHEFTGDVESTDVLDFMRIGYRRNVGEVVSIRNYVGLIQMKNGFQIQVLPKIAFGEEDKDNVKTKKVFLKMLRSMRNFPSKTFNNASLKIDQMNLYELFINMYLQEVRQLVKHGIKSSYVEQKDNLHYYKGKLLVNEHVRGNLIHKERFYVSYDAFHPNRAENRLVKATLIKLQKLTTSAENSKEIRQLLTVFETVDASVNYAKDFSKVVLNRNTKDYETLLQWSKVFLMNKSFTIFSGSTVSRALLFPMESVYESYVAQQMKKVICILSAIAILLCFWLIALWLPALTDEDKQQDETRFGVSEGLELVEQTYDGREKKYIVEDDKGNVVFTVPLRGCIIDTRYRDGKLRFREQDSGREGYIDCQGIITFLNDGKANIPE